LKKKGKNQEGGGAKDPLFVSPGGGNSTPMWGGCAGGKKGGEQLFFSCEVDPEKGKKGERI